MPIENTGPIRLRGAAGDGRTDINEEINGNVTDTDVSLGTLNTARYATVAEGNTPSGRSMSEMRGYAAFDSAFPSTEADGALGESLVYDTNSSSYASFTPSFDGNRKTWTVSAWVKFNRTGSRETIISQGSTSVLDVVHMTKHSDDKLRIYIERSGGEISILGGSLILDTSGWYNIVFAFDATKSYTNDKCRIYVNGIEDTGVTISGTFTDSDYGFNKANNPIRIGQYRYTNSYYLDGVIADFKFIDGKQLRPDSFGELVQGIWIPKAFNTASTDTLVTSNLTANYDFVNGSMEDSSGNGNHLTKNNTGGQYYANNYGFWETPGSTAQFLKMPDIINSHSTTISMWIHPTSTGVRELFFHATKEIYGIWERTSSNKYQVYFGSAGYVIQNIEAENKWVMLTLTTHGARDVKFYIDGILVNEVTASSDLQQNYNYYDNTLGYTHHTSTPNDGKMGFGEVQIYSVGLSPDQVKQNYNATKHKYTYGLNGFWLPLNNTSTGSIVDDSSLKLHLDASDSSSYSGSGTNWNDLTSNGNDATIYGSPNYLSTNGGYFDLDGSNDYIVFPGSTISHTSDQDFTIETWLKFASVPTSSAYNFIGSTNSANRSPVNAWFYGTGSGLAISLERYFNSTQYYSSGYNSNVIHPFVADKWYQIVITYNSNGRVVTVYVNGKQEDNSYTLNISNGSQGTTSYDMTIGNYNSTSFNNFDIAQFRIYNDVLTAQEVIANYRATQGNYEQVSTVDISGNANSFTATNIDATDHIKDEPLDNYATFDPNLESTGGTLSEGNLKVTSSADTFIANKSFNSGKWYAEFTLGSTTNAYISVFGTDYINPNMGGGWSGNGVIAYRQGGDQYSLTKGGSSSTSSYGASYTSGDVIGIEVDVTGDTIEFYKNGVSQGQTINGPSYIGTTHYSFAAYGNTSTITANFGQKPWAYGPSTGFLALSTKNLSAPAFDPDGATPDKPSNYFKAVTYQGNGGTQGEAYGYKEGSRAAVFNGSSGKIVLPNFPQLPSNSNNANNFTFSFWVKSTTTRLNNGGGSNPIFQNYVGSYQFIGFGGDDNANFPTGRIFYYTYGGVGYHNSWVITSDSYADGEWHHVVVTDKYNSSGDNRTRTIYIDGIQRAQDTVDKQFYNSTETNPFIGFASGSGSRYLNCDLDEVRIFNKALSPTEVGYLADDDTSNIDAISNLVAHYDMEGDANNADIISTNFATWDATLSSIPNYSEGNLRMTGGNGNKIGYSNEIVSSGKWYWEHEVIAIGAESSFGIARPGDLSSHYVVGTSSTSWGLYVNGNIYHNGSNLGSYMSGGFTNGDIIGVELDIDNGTLEFYKNGTGYGNAFTGLSGEFVVAAEARTTSGINDHRTNFGASAWDYTPSTGFSGIYLKYNGTSNNVTYTQDKPYGNIDVGFAPDLVWIKSRSTATNNELHDSLRPEPSRLLSDTTNAELTVANGFVSLDSNGFSLDGAGDGGEVNYSGRTYVAWAWKAGGKAVENTDGTIASQVSANQDAGFSIVKFSNNNSSSNTFGHGLGGQPELVFIKGLNVSNDWFVYVDSLGKDKRLKLNESDAVSSWTTNDGTNTSTGINSTVLTFPYSATSYNFIAYCFRSISGYQRIGSYTGNGSTDGPFVYTGFKPAFVMLKRTDAGSSNWFIIDNARKNVNPNGAYLLPNEPNAENDLIAYSLEFFSNGYKLNSSDVQMNANGGTYIYMAFAEDPVKYSNGVATLGDGNEFIQGGNYPEDNFSATTYAGTNALQKITIGFKPDLIWFKNRTGAYLHQIYDSIRGADKSLNTGVGSIGNRTGTEAEFNDGGNDLMSFDADGFSLGLAALGSVNESGFDHIAWSWKAAGNDNTYNILENGTVTSSASASTLGLDTGTITPDGISANKDNGFSIIKWTGNGISGSKINHGLSKRPEIIITKGLTNPTSWVFGIGGIPGLGDNDYMTLNTTSVLGTSSTFYQAYDANTFTVGVSSANEMNKNSSNEYISYAWHSVPGFSKIGTYSGTNAAGNAQDLGFEPAFVMVKRYVGAASNWVIFENKRPGGILRFDLNNVEASDTRITLTSTGFQFTGSAYNETNTKWIYMAFAHR